MKGHNSWKCTLVKVGFGSWSAWYNLLRRSLLEEKRLDWSEASELKLLLEGGVFLKARRWLSVLVND